MGAETFFQLSKGKTAAAAFKAAVEQAQYDYGHSGYTGTVAEKDSFVKIPFAVDHSNTAEPWRQAEAFADRLISDRDSRIDDKWGPAGCIEYTPGEFLFFGWASS